MRRARADGPVQPSTEVTVRIHAASIRRLHGDGALQPAVAGPVMGIDLLLDWDVMLPQVRRLP